MSASAKLLVLVGLLFGAWGPDPQAGPKTVCTITINSSDEREVFRRSLSPDEFQVVELVEHGRPDWLESACRKGVRCDVLLISGHFDGGTEFYSDRLDVREYLPVDAIERVSCSDSCPGLFAQLKEVYLFGCNTLNAGAMRSASAEIGRSLVRSGHTAADAERLTRDLNARYRESNRDRMRNIFKDVPVIYGFPGQAPLGRSAGPLLERYFQSGAGGEVGTGRASPKLLSLFAPSAMTATVGSTDADPHASFRQDVCRLVDDRVSAAQKVGFVHRLMNREMAEVRMFLDHIEKYSTSLTESDRQAPPVSSALDAIARDQALRARYLAFARDADQSAVSARMIALARDLGWLSPAAEREELIHMIGDRLTRNAVGPAEVDLVCELNKDGDLGRERHRLQVSPPQASRVPHAAVLACLGSAEGHAQVMRALTSPHEHDVQIAQVYLRHRPIDDGGELRAVTTGIAQMNGSEAQVRALDTLARLRVSDRESLEALTRLFQAARSVTVQRAIAGILIRSDNSAFARPELARSLRQHRLKSPDGEDLIDILIRRLQAP